MENSSDYTAFGARLKEVLAYLFKSQLEAAYHLGSQPSQLYKYFSGKNLPSYQFLERLAIRGVNVMWLITGQGPMMVDGTDEAQALGIKEGRKESPAL